ncbi:helix-turn-helix domain-containing protein [Streptomyces sp. Amel2xC10]|uniref:helix-turn-helix domain-containing protein n=1 Tax=Streptomyces sp. Amel2xC10 TaxID=1305826 RepID=UPI000A08EC99|nr:helix-turn-helix domain-containing protein [Streptomyces sp. Amel2xC10]SMF77023.1 Transcriptional regulator, contains XRE-family HTH domain [Streptomyces sp. Amel2xC10]
MSDRAGQNLADRLNQLFATVRPDPHHEYSNEYVAAAIRRSTADVSISQSYIWQLRNGRKNNPTLKHLQALAGFFGVPTAYFVEDEAADRITEQLEALASEQARLHEASKGNDVKLMAMRAGQLSPEHRKQVMDLLDVVYRLEQAERENLPRD